jgi:hypothetical protein
MMALARMRMVRVSGQDVVRIAHEDPIVAVRQLAYEALVEHQRCVPIIRAVHRVNVRGT